MIAKRGELFIANADETGLLVTTASDLIIVTLSQEQETIPSLQIGSIIPVFESFRLMRLPSINAGAFAKKK